MGKTLGRQGTRVLVTGGAGFIGSHLVRALVGAGYSVRVLDDLSTGKRERLKGLPIELLHADVRNPAAVRRAIDGAHIVYHLAARRAVLEDDAGPDDRPVWSASEVNVGAALNVLDAARQIPAPRVILGGTGDVYGRAAAYLLHEEVAPVPATPEGVQSHAVEQYARLHWEAYRVPATVLRIFSTFGPDQEEESDALVPRLCRAVLAGETPLIEGEARHTRDLSYVTNVVGALVAAATASGVEGQVFNIASGEATAVATVWSLLCELAGRKRQALEPEYHPARSWEQVNVRVSIARACRTLGYAPTVRLREGLRRTLEAVAGGGKRSTTIPTTSVLAVSRVAATAAAAGRPVVSSTSRTSSVITPTPSGITPIPSGITPNPTSPLPVAATDDGHGWFTPREATAVAPPSSGPPTPPPAALLPRRRFWPVGQPDPTPSSWPETVRTPVPAPAPTTAVTPPPAPLPGAETTRPVATRNPRWMRPARRSRPSPPRVPVATLELDEPEEWIEDDAGPEAGAGR